MGFTLAQTSSLLVPETTMSKSLGASFSELTGQLTPPYLDVLGPSTVAPITGTTKTIPSSVASFEPVTLVVSATATAVEVTPLPTVILPESQAAQVPEQTRTTSHSLPATEGQTAQSSGSEDDATQF